MTTRLIIAISVLLFVSGPPALAGSLSGGGTGQLCGGRIVDNVVRTGKDWAPAKDMAFEKVVLPVLRRVKECLPYLYEDLEMTLLKPWRRVKCRLRSDIESRGEKSYFDADTMAYQDRLSISLDNDRLNEIAGESKEALSERGTLILHELVQGIRVQKNLLKGPLELELEEEAVVDLTADLLDGKFPTCKAMQAGVFHYLRTGYALRSELERLNLAPEQVRVKTLNKCDKGQRAIPLAVEMGLPHAIYYFNQSGTTRGSFYDKAGFHFLSVPLEDWALREDASLRAFAHYGLLRSTGFYDFPAVEMTDPEETCRRARELPVIDRDFPQPTPAKQTAEPAPETKSGETDAK